jgi:hypothetical protein
MRLLVQVFLIFLVITIMLSIVRGLLAPSTPVRRTSPGPRRPMSAGKLVKDPVCGTYVAEESALQAGGSFFCSEECRQKFVSRG